MKSTPLDDLKAVLRAAERERDLEQAADFGRVKIRLQARPTVRRRLLVFRSEGPGYPDHEFDQAETDALYEALAIVRDDHAKRAAELEAKALSLTARGSEEDR
jgi:hypothetical protein